MCVARFNRLSLTTNPPRFERHLHSQTVDRVPHAFAVPQLEIAIVCDAPQHA
jgi:hypothetical protein